MNHTLPELVRDSELETHFLPDCSIETVHTYHERSPYSRGLVSRTEHWKRLRKVGGGGFGTVWLERCTKGGHGDIGLRAVKQLEIAPRFTQLDYGRELEAIAKFSQWKYERCFVKSFGWFQSPEHLFISMEYLELGDLHSYLQKNPPLPEPEAKDISYQILDGLCLMHSNGFTHRDLKPNNILLKSCPPIGWWIKIADFGISKRVEDGLGVPTTTKGTAGYMAPELLGFTERSRPYAIDVWAVGEITFRMLTKKPSFKNPGLISKYVTNLEIFPVDVLRTARISQSGIEFILSAMHPMPDKRITAEEALHHAWMDQSLCGFTAHTNDEPSHGPATSMATNSQEEELASWNTTTDLKPPTTVREAINDLSEKAAQQAREAIKNASDRASWRARGAHKKAVQQAKDESLCTEDVAKLEASLRGVMGLEAQPKDLNLIHDKTVRNEVSEALAGKAALDDGRQHDSFAGGSEPVTAVRERPEHIKTPRKHGAWASAWVGLGGDQSDDDVTPRSSRNSRPDKRHPSLPSLKPSVNELKFSVPLELLLHGVTEKIRVGTCDSDGRRTIKVLKVAIRPGMRAGTKLKFRRVGYMSDGRPEDFLIILEEKAHPDFVRQGDDLITTVRMSGLGLLRGWKKTIPTIDGSAIRLSVRGRAPIEDYEERFPGLGMPKLREPGSRGDLIVRVLVSSKR